MTYPKTYWGARFTSDAGDCVLPISIDSHSTCSFNCLYCFSNSLMHDTSRNLKKAQQLLKLNAPTTEFSFETFKKLMEGKLNNCWARAMNPLIKQRVPIQIGALSEPLDKYEKESKWLFKTIEFLKEINYPTRISTKGAKTLMEDGYLDLLKGSKNFWFAFSIISSNDELISKIDLGAPTASERIEAMKALSKMGIPVTLRYRPIIPPLAEKEYDGKPDWKILIDKAVKAGVRAISYEIIFLNQLANHKQRLLYKHLEKIISEETNCKNFLQFWKYLSIKNQPCLRANRLYKYKLMMNIRNYAKKKGLNVGISDPHFKEYSDYPCCCMCIPRDDPMFGNYSTSMTDIVIEGRKHYEKTGENLRFKFTDWCPEWGKNIRLNDMCNVGDATKKQITMNVTWYDAMRKKWNNPSHPRSPYNYFEGILYPVGLDENKNVIYEYRHWATQIYKKPLPELDVKEI